MHLFSLSCSNMVPRLKHAALAEPRYSTYEIAVVVKRWSFYLEQYSKAIGLIYQKSCVIPHFHYSMHHTRCCGIGKTTYVGRDGFAPLL